MTAVLNQMWLVRAFFHLSLCSLHTCVCWQQTQSARARLEKLSREDQWQCCVFFLIKRGLYLSANLIKMESAVKNWPIMTAHLCWFSSYRWDVFNDRIKNILLLFFLLAFPHCCQPMSEKRHPARNVCHQLAQAVHFSLYEFLHKFAPLTITDPVCSKELFTSSE